MVGPDVGMADLAEHGAEPTGGSGRVILDRRTSVGFNVDSAVECTGNSFPPLLDPH